MNLNTLKEGDKAPYFEGLNQNGDKVSLEDFKGKKLILYFYPKDFTSGCTNEACNFRDNYEYWKSKGFEIIGISPDSIESHIKFKEKNNLPFHLISDVNREIIKKYGAWGEKNMYGKKVEGVLRKTFVINEKGIIEKIYSKVDTKNHTEQILKDLS